MSNNIFFKSRSANSLLSTELKNMLGSINISKTCRTNMNETRYVKSAHGALRIRSRKEQKEDFKTGCVTIKVFLGDFKNI